MNTTASIFLKTLADAGVTHAFVNWGNDHPAFLEDLEQQRTANGGETAPRIVTCPNEMVALSAAQGYAQVTGTPAAVIVHVDVGTQALAGAVHNVDRGRTPVLIFAGASPATANGELKGSKNEWPMWPQDVADQPAIVRQYMRYTAQIYSGTNVAKTIMRSLQIATSDPKGPVYLWARREALEQEFDAAVVNSKLDLRKWPSIIPAALPPAAVQTILDAVLTAKFPLIITSHIGRNVSAVTSLAEISRLLSIAVFTSCASGVAIPFSHPYYLGSYFAGKNHILEEADVIILLDVDVPWIENGGSTPRDGARIFVVDQDPLKPTWGWSHVDAELICRADAETALQQLLHATQSANAALPDDAKMALNDTLTARGNSLQGRHNAWVQELDNIEATIAADGVTPSTANVMAALRRAVLTETASKGDRVLWLNEAISNYGLVFDHVRPEIPGSMLCSGGSSLGWALGAAVGAYIGGEIAQKNHELLVAVVGDGTFMFAVPSTAYWMARRYKTPFLTIILNNGGWKSPKMSMLGIYPQGQGSVASGQQLTTGFGPDMPDYSQIAVAAGGAWGRRVERVHDLEATIKEAIRIVQHERRSAVVDCVIQSI